MSFPIELPPAYRSKAAALGIRGSDVVEQFIRGSGHGGQKVNKTSSTVFLKHVPSGLEVKCQTYRERPKNRLSAWKLLILKIEKKEHGKKSAIMQKAFKIRKQKKRRSRKAKEKVLEAKHHRSEVKGSRRFSLRDLF